MGAQTLAFRLGMSRCWSGANVSSWRIVLKKAGDLSARANLMHSVKSRINKINNVEFASCALLA